MTTPDIHNMTAAEIAVSIQTAQIAHLQAQNAELLAALEQIAERIAGGFPGYQKESALYELGCKAQNAIARAKGDA